jgi:hypothetical protein
MDVAQAADLPMGKAEPVEYVRQCPQFTNDEFFYIPGTDTCLAISEELRADTFIGERDSRDDSLTQFQTSARLKFDARTMTDYGTLRSFIEWNAETGSISDSQPRGFYVRRAFLQFGGLTAGYEYSFFGFYNADYGDTIFAPYYGEQSRVNLLAYTAALGGGFTAALSLEDGRDHRSGIYGIDNAALPVATFADGDYAGQTMPDIVGAFKVEQAWGKAGLFGAVHEKRFPNIFAAGPPATFLPGYDPPDAEYGWAAGAAVVVNFDWLSGGYVVVEASYADGANDYLGLSSTSEAVYLVNAPFDVDQGSGWSLVGEASLKLWPNLEAIVFGSYVEFEGAEFAAAPGAALPRVGYEQGDFSAYVVGANLTYTVVKGLKVTGEIYYQDQDFDPVTVASVTTFPAGVSQIAGGLRVRRDF